jgi:hypothetical protein
MSAKRASAPPPLQMFSSPSQQTVSDASHELLPVAHVQIAAELVPAGVAVVPIFHLRYLWCLLELFTARKRRGARGGSEENASLSCFGPNTYTASNPTACLLE